MDNKTKTIAFHTLGCKVNEYESGKLSRELEEQGWIQVPFDSPADVYVVNTCSVTHIADHKSRQMLNRARAMAEETGALTVAMGCYASLEKSGITADLIIENKDRDKAAALIIKAVAPDSDLETDANANDRAGAGLGTGLKSDAGSGFESSSDPEPDPNSDRDSDQDSDPDSGRQILRARKRTRAFIKVEDGCDSFCTYCVIPYARGPVRSMHPDEILKEVMTCVSSGVKEIVITGINVNRYGTGLITEKPAYIGEPLAELLKRIALESGIGRIRLSSVEPGLINDDFVSRVSEIDAVCPHFHMALQSGSAGVLKRMNRHYTPDDYRKSAELLRRYYDDPALTTDVIVGFPGETDEEHRESMDLIKDVALYSLNVFRFSARRGTPAYSMPDQIRNSVKEARAHEMLSLCDDLRSAYEERHRGRTLRVLFEENEPDGSVSGYSKEYIRVSSPTGHPGELADIVF